MRRAGKQEQDAAHAGLGALAVPCLDHRNASPRFGWFPPSCLPDSNLLVAI